MKSFATLAILGAVSANETNPYKKYMQYLSHQGKSYNSIEEFNMRMANFNTIDLFIEEWNSQEDKTHTVGHNFLSDWTQAERDVISGKAGGNGAKLQQKQANYAVFEADPNATYPAEWNWDNGKNVGAVQNQNRCGDCYAFAGTGAVQSAMSIKYDQTVELYSVQQVTACSQAYGNDGCNGGNAAWVFEYLQTNPIVSAAVYPFTSGNGTCAPCVAQKSSDWLAETTSTPYVRLGAYPNYPTQATMQAAIYQQPNAVAVDASQNVFQQYTSGVITSTTCGTNLDHAILAVGYSTGTSEGDYWIVENSWGTSWGMNGYVRIGMSSGVGICGINKQVEYPNVQTPA